MENHQGGVRFKIKSVPFFDLCRQNQELGKELDEAWKRVVRSSQFILGDELSSFEENFAVFIGTRYAIGVSTGLDALSLALRALSIGPQDEVILPAHTFIATALAVSSVGARPVLVDVGERDLLVEVDEVKKAVTKKTKALIPVHLYGQPVEMQPLMSFARSRSLAVIEDVAQAHGASIGKQKCGAFGEAGCFSFYPSKNLGAFGDGGLITTNDSSIYRQLGKLRNYGSTMKYRHDIIGFNHRLDNLQASFLNVKLKQLERWNQKRNVLAARYDERLSSLSQVNRMPRRKGFRCVYHLYVIRVSRRDALKKFLEKRKVSTAIHYPLPVHLQEAYRFLGYRKGDFPVAEKAAGEVLSLPMYPEMTMEQVDTVCQTITEFYRS